MTITPHGSSKTVSLHHGDCLALMAELPDNSVDAIVTDPPYGLGFMGKEWDALPPGLPWARECLRVLKPGGHLLAFGGTRTSHRLACAVEDAGFEIRDSIAWLYGSGFPKSLDVSKAIDKARTEDRAPVDAVRSWLNSQRIAAGFSHDAVNKHFGHASNGGGSSSAWMTNPTSKSLPTWDQWLELKALFSFTDEMDAEVVRLNDKKGSLGEAWDSREVVGMHTQSDPRLQSWAEMQGNERGTAKEMRGAPATDDARTWQGWGTALKPAHEPIVVARKPLTGTVAANVLTHGTGALNVDGCRVEGDVPQVIQGGQKINGGRYNDSAEGESRHTLSQPHAAGRWPANVVLDESQADALDAQSGAQRDGTAVNRNKDADAAKPASVYGEFRNGDLPDRTYGGEGGASRFFYVAKADASERPVIFRPTCECEDSWPTPTPSAARATDATTGRGSSSTSKHGKATMGGPSQAATRFTTSTETSSTTTPTISSPSPRPITSASTRDANCETASGGNPAATVASSSESGPATGISAAKGGRSTDVAAPAILHGWSATSVCGNCGAPSRREAHATVKPLALMRWLVRLVTPPGGTVLEPFAGSGTTVEACILEGFRCIAIEREADYLPLIMQRINRRVDPVAAVLAADPDDGGLFDLLDGETA